MVLLFSVHATFGVVEPQFTSNQIADVVDVFASQYGVPLGPGFSAITVRPEPENEEEEVQQAVNPGTHEVNFIFDFDPNTEDFLAILAEDTMLNRYNVANQLCSTILFAAFHSLDSIPTYFNMKIVADYVDSDLYEKAKKQRFNP